jgi:hypothetical protein
VAFLNWRFGLTQMTTWRMEVAPFPGLSNVATPTKAIITIPMTLYGCGNGDDAEEGGPERRRVGREHGEHKRDKARRCRRPTGPLRAGVAQHSSSSQRSPGLLRAPIPYPDETFTIVVVVSSDTSLIACAPSSVSARNVCRNA